MATPSRPAAVAGAGAQNGEPLGRSEKLIIGTGCVAGVIVIGALTYFLFVRDRWENGHRLQLESLITEANGLSRRHDLTGAEAKYNELFSLVGKNSVRDHALKESLASARVDFADVTKRLDAQREHERLVAAAEAERKHKMELEAAVKRQADAERKHQMELEAAAERQAEAEAAERQRMEAQQRDEERRREEALANEPRIVTGAAWLTRGNGANDDQRGMTIYVLAPAVSRQASAETYKALMQTVAKEADSIRRQRAIVAKPSGFQDLNDMNRAEVESYDRMLDGITKLADILKSRSAQSEVATEQLFQSIRAVNGCQDTTGRIVAGMTDNQALRDYSSQFRQVAKDELWAKTVALALIGKGRTDSTGHYRLELKKGRYVIYAVSQNNFSIAEWAIPIDATVPGSRQLDLSNENASIVNR